MHNHVLEHLPCDIVPVLREFRRILKPGGTMAFSIPIIGPTLREDLDPALPADQRSLRFGNPTHMRVFGKNDVLALLRQGLGQGLQNGGAGFTQEELDSAAVPGTASDLTAVSTLVYVKPTRSVMRPAKLELHPPQHYRAKARACRNLARLSYDSVSREDWLKIAADWERLARQLELRQEHSERPSQ